MSPSLQEPRRRLVALPLEEHNVRVALDDADDAYIILGWKVVHHSTAAELKDHPGIQEQYGERYIFAMRRSQPALPNAMSAQASQTM